MTAFSQKMSLYKVSHPSMASKELYNKLISFFRESTFTSQDNSTTQVIFGILTFFHIEFLLSTINLKELLNKEKLRAMFKIFDADNLGKVTLNDIYETVTRNGVKESKIWPQILKDAGKEGSELLTFQDFNDLMM